MLISSFTHSLDAKGRIFVPAKWREDVGDTLVVTIGLTGSDSSCLYGMSMDAWDTFSRRLIDGMPLSDKDAQAVLRRLYASAAACELDKQGRILLPVSLREAVGLNKDITLIGMGNRIEFWNPEAYLRHTEATQAQYDQMLKHLLELKI